MVHVAKTKGDYLEAMTRQFRKDLISSGSQIKQQDSKIYMRIPAQSVFGTNQATIKSSFEKVMKSIAENLKKYPETLKVIPILLAKRESEIYCQDENGGKTFNFNFGK